MMFQIVVLMKTLESLLNRKEIKPVNPKGNQPWIFTGRTVMLKLQYFGLLFDAKSRLTGKDPDAGKDWGQKRAIEDEMVGWHHQLNRHEFEQTQREWKTRKPGMLQSVGSQRVGRDWATTKERRKADQTQTLPEAWADSEAPFLGFILPPPTFSSYWQGQWGLRLEVGDGFQ